MTGPVLVTGAQGFLGRYVVAELIETQRADVIGIGRSPRQPHHFTHDITVGSQACRAPLPDALRRSAHALHYAQLDLADAAAVSALINRARPSRIIHLAGALRDEPWPALLSGNVAATIHLCEAARALTALPEVLLGSSGSVYGAAAGALNPDATWPRPIGAYAASKLMAETAATTCLADAGLRPSIARIFNLVGPGLQPRHLAADVAHRIAAIEAGLAEPTLTLGSLDTERDFIDVRDAARLIARWPQQACGGVANVASGTATPVRQVVSKLCASSSQTITLAFDDSRSRPGPPAATADISGMLDFALIPLAKSLADMLDYARWAAVRKD